MNPQNRTEPFHVLISEALLPLLFLAGAPLFYAAALIPVAAGITLLVFEMLRRQPRRALSAVYLFWLAVCGGLGWFFAAIPPYWIWCVHLLLPETVRAPSDAQQAKPFLFGLKKYFKRRVFELAAALILFFAFAAAAAWLRQKLQGAAYWVSAIFALLVFEVVFAVIRNGRQGLKK